MFYIQCSAAAVYSACLYCRRLHEALDAFTLFHR